MTHDRRILESALLVTRLQRGDEDAFAEIVHLWELPLLYYLRRLAPTEADAWELLQDTWLKAFRGLNSLREPRVCQRTCIASPAMSADPAPRLGVKFETFDEQLVPAHADDPEESWLNAEAVASCTEPATAGGGEGAAHCFFCRTCRTTTSPKFWRARLHGQIAHSLCEAGTSRKAFTRRLSWPISPPILSNDSSARTT